jgi:hypothetical protein
VVERGVYGVAERILIVSEECNIPITRFVSMHNALLKGRETGCCVVCCEGSHSRGPCGSGSISSGYPVGGQVVCNPNPILRTSSQKPHRIG